MLQGTNLTIENLLENSLYLIQENKKIPQDYRKVLILCNLTDAYVMLCNELAVSKCSTPDFTMKIK